MSQESTLTTAIISGPVYQTHQTGGHPENTTRARALHELASELLAVPVNGACFIGLEPEPISVNLVEAVHTPGYIAALNRFCLGGGGALDLNTVVSRGSYQAALCAAGGLKQGVDAIMNGRATSAFALARPPGHHAVAGSSQGFCLFNNIAIAASYLLETCGLERILILDWDVHHGNGTQDMFYDDPRVMFFSSHQYPLYPGSGSLHETGRNSGKGYNINLPLPAGCGDAVLERAFEALLEPLASRFKPQFILVSAGYDGHWRDPLAHLTLSAAGYARLTRSVMNIADTFCQGRLALTLEGGYDLEALTSSVRATLLTLAGLDPALAAQDDPVGQGSGGYSPELTPLKDLIQQARRLHQV